jgi:co-chaperonin GroES (HSP10)
MAVKPILHRIIVLPDKIEEKDQHFKRAARAGILVAGAEREREQAAIDTGKVIDIGPTAFKDFGAEAPPIEVGSYVVYARYAGKTIEDPETEIKYVALNDEDVIAILTTVDKEPKNG